MPSQRDLLLITGIPGTGKTTYGDKFASQFGFLHYDLENQQTLNRLNADPTQFIPDIVSQNRGSVVTWGFVPDDPASVSLVLQFRKAGFKLVWFDGNREAALRAFQERVKSKSSSEAEFYLRMHEFYLQMYRVEATKVIDALKPAVVDPFNAQGSFKLAAALLDEIRNA